MKHEEIVNFLQEYSKKNGWGEIEKGKLIPHLLKEENVLATFNEEKHRWYISKTSVVKVEDKYFSFLDYQTLGDGSISDMGIEFDDLTITEVEPVEVTVTTYKPVKGVV